MHKTTSFGFQEVEVQHKQHMVQSVFTRVASSYDLMNDLMSCGMHHWWKQELITELAPAPHESLIDVAGGTGDVASKFLEYGGGSATVVDLNQAMLDVGAKKLSKKSIQWCHASAEDLPFPDASFDFYTISFGIRNVTNIPKALKEAQRVLKIGGKFVCLEFSHVSTPGLKQLYNWYSFNVIPKLGRVIANDEEAYRYLVESIARFHRAPQFAAMLKAAGLSDVYYRKLSGGIVAMHIGYKHA